MSSTDRRRVVVTGVGMMSPLGDAEAFAASLRNGSSTHARGVTPLTAFDPSPLLSSANGDGAQTRDWLAGQVDFDPSRDLGGGNVRPIDRTGRLVAAAAGAALRSAGWSETDLDEREVGLVLGTMYGSVHTISAFDRRGLEAGPKYVKPLDFANSVINAAAGQTAIWHGLRGPNSTVAGGVTAGLQALGLAAELIRGGRADALLAGGGDELCLESYFGFVRAGLVAEGRPRPFDRSRDGFVPAEGAALLLLEAEESARARGAEILGVVRGHATAFDPGRARSVDSAARALERAAVAALDDAALEDAALDIAAVSAGASGARVGDLAEARALHGVLAPRAAEVPVTAIKSRLGEPLGAGGGFQAVALLHALRGGTLPAIEGFEAPDPEAPDLVYATSPHELTGTLGLATGVGLDGHAVALVLEAL